MRVPLAIPPSRHRPYPTLLAAEEYSAIKEMQKQAEAVVAQPEITPVTAPTPPPLPSKFEMAKNLTKSAFAMAKGVIRGEALKETDSEAQRRLEICQRCEFFRKSDQRCSRCGCYMSVKTYLKSSKCPLPVPRW